jgi:hypothetical protein
MSEETFKLPGSSYEELCKIIQAYGKLTKPSSLEDVSQTVKMHATAISRNNAFLSTAGIIEGGRLKSATILGKKLARALDYEHSNEISSAWREIVKTNEFLSKMLAAIRIRKTMDITTFQSHIAYSAGRTKSTNIMAGAKAIIEILKSAELIIEKDGQLIPSDVSIEAGERLPSEQEISSQLKRSQEQEQTVIEISQVPTDSRNVSVSIQIRLDVKPEELDGLGIKLRKLLDEITAVKPIDTGIVK